MARQRTPRSWKEEWKDLFAMHRGERRAFTLLIGICILAAAWGTWEQWIRPSQLADREAKALQVVWQAMQDSLETQGRPAVRKQDDIQLFPFDPNGLPRDQWVLLGLSERQADVILRYEERGGQFRSKEDLARMRVVDPELFAQWEPFILLPERKPYRGTERRAGNYRPWDTTDRPAGGKERSVREVKVVEINAADSAGLVEVRGIGPAFARSIIGYRERLGGFISLDQLQEVPILRNKPDAVERIRPQLEVDPDAVRPIPINSCTVEELAGHPYMNWKVAKALIAYRDQHGPFRDVDAISGCLLVTDSLKERMRPYLEVE